MDNKNTNEEVVKPTLDSILNAGEVTPQVTPEPSPAIDSLPTLEYDAVVDTSAQNLESITPMEELETEVASLSPVSEIPVMESIDTIEDINVEPKVEPIPTTEVLTETLEETTPIEYPTNDFEAVPAPPEDSEKPSKTAKKKNNKKTMIFVLLLLLVAIVGFGVYYFLTTVKKAGTKSITPKEVKIELGTSLSKNMEDYVTILGYKKSACSINLENVNVNKVSTYKYTVTCEKSSIEGLVIVDDTTKPEAKVTDLIVVKDATLKAEDFIEECKDASTCSYRFQTNVEGLTRNLGDYDVEIVVSDEYNNQSVVKAKLTVATQAPAKYLTCRKQAQEVESLGATLVDGYKVGIDASDNFYNSVRMMEYTFKNKNDYNKSVSGYNETKTINNIGGEATFNESNMSILLKGNRTLEEMNSELNGRLPNNFNIIRAYLSGLGYICN